MVAEIRAQSRRNLFFVDDNLIADPVAAKSLLRALIPLHIRWVSQASVDQARDPELMRLFADSGCLGTVIGFESLDPDDLRAMGKRHNLVGFDRYASVVAALRAHHLQTWAAFLLGYDHETPESIAATCDWALEQRFTFAAYNILMPYPGTLLYDRLAAEGRLLYDGRWWLHPDYRFNHAAFRPARMTADQLTEAAWDARRRWSSPRSIVTRALDPATNLASPFRLALYCATTRCSGGSRSSARGCAWVSDELHGRHVHVPPGRARPMTSRKSGGSWAPWRCPAASRCASNGSPTTSWAPR